MGSVKGESKSANFQQGKVETHRHVRIFGKGKCKRIANISVTMVTSIPSLSLSFSLSLSVSLSVCHRVHLTHNIGSAAALPITESNERAVFVKQQQ